MTKKVKNNELFTNVNSALLTLFKQNEYPWETLKHLKEWMDEILKTMIEFMETSGAGFSSVTIGDYAIMITNEKEGAEWLSNAWDEYVEEK